MAAIFVATKANQATFLPALLVASYVNENDPNAHVAIHLQDVNTLKSGDNATVNLESVKKQSSSGSESVITQLIQAFHVLQTKHTDFVSYRYHGEFFDHGN